MNCTRLVSSDSAAARARTSSVFATPGHALEQHVAAAEQGDHQAGDGGVLADDGLADLVLQRAQRLAGVGVAARTRSRSADLPLEGVEVVGEPHQRAVVGRCGTVQERCDVRPGPAGAGGDRGDDGRRLGPARQAERRCRAGSRTPARNASAACPRAPLRR